MSVIFAQCIPGRQTDHAHDRPESGIPVHLERQPAAAVPRAGRRVLIVYNPAAGQRRSQLLWRVLDVMAENGVRLELAETRRPGHAEALARAAAASGAQMVVAAGGDGTIAEVASGLIGTSARLGVIPLGTANVLARELALPFAPRAVAAALAFGRTRRLWPGLACGNGSARLFVQMLGVGFDAQVVRNVASGLKRALGQGAYLAQGARELARYDFRPVSVLIDGAAMEAGSVIVSKGRLYAGRHLLAPEAIPQDRGFSVSLFAGTGPLAAMLYGAALPFGMLPRLPGVRRLRASRVEFIGPAPVPAQSDGDPAGTTPLCITDAEAPIEVVVA